NLRSDEPVQRTRAPRRKAFDVNPAHASLLEGERAARADEMRGKLAQAGFVADEREPATAGRAGELRQDGARRMPRRQRVEHLDRGFAGQAAGENFSGLLGADERAREDLVDRYVEPRQSAD